MNLNAKKKKKKSIAHVQSRLNWFLYFWIFSSLRWFVLTELYEKLSWNTFILGQKTVITEQSYRNPQIVCQ